MPRPTQPKHTSSNVALCYVRLSWSKDEGDANSPERQRANIQIVCDQHGWIPEWYEDTDGHKSGTQEKNRPGWLALKTRLTDPDVVALVANDLSRLHRKGWRIGDLLDFVDEHQVRLVLAAPGKQLDFATPQGRIVAQMSALFDEWYAMDISQRSKDMIAHRKRQGKTVGLPPFGTVRDKRTGYLIPSSEGAWLLPDGSFLAGTLNEPPQPDAVWRSYYAAAQLALSRYAEGEHGLDSLAYALQAEGWAFRNRQGQPTRFSADDVRRIVANWPEYGGFVSAQRARERHPHRFPIDQIRLSPERAVFDTELLYRVGQVRATRTIKRTPNDGVTQEAFPYPLANITFCAHCEQHAQQHNDPRLRSRLSGKGKDHLGRYRHKAGVHCGCTNRSVKRELFEADFRRLLSLLTVSPTELENLTQLGVDTLRASQGSDEPDMLARKRSAIAKCQRRIEAARHLYEDGELSREEYLRRKEANEREIAHWEARSADSEQVALELALCVEALERINQLWDISDDEDRQGMARNLFSYIVYDLDTQRITDFRLKPWADRFVILRHALYAGESTGGGEGDSFVSRQGKGVTPTGTEHIFAPSPSEAICRAISWIYRLPRKLNRRLRDSMIRARHAAGETLMEELTRHRYLGDESGSDDASSQHKVTMSLIHTRMRGTGGRKGEIIQLDANRR